MSLRRKVLRILARTALVLAALLVVGAGGLLLEILSREPLRAIPGTVHPQLARGDCIECHAPIAAEWRESFHHRSLTGPYWRDVRELGYMRVFDRTRKACVNCHAPANVLDLQEEPSSRSVRGSWGVECSPNLLREPRGVIPAARADEVELGVDCTSCHVDHRGVVGSGRHSTTAHAVVADARFQDPVLASEKLCRSCHSAAVRAWESTTFAAGGVTCLDCHMPFTTAASTVGGEPRRRRSHRFPGDKDPAMLSNAVHASLTITADHRARFHLTNDRVGHALPSGGNWLSVQLRVRDASGDTLQKHVEVFGKEEPLLLDFWPFNVDRRIAAGEDREIFLPLPSASGTVEAIVRYHDWMRTRATVLELRTAYPARGTTLRSGSASTRAER